MVISLKQAIHEYAPPPLPPAALKYKKKKKNCSLSCFFYVQFEARRHQLCRQASDRASPVSSWLNRGEQIAARHLLYPRESPTASRIYQVLTPRVDHRFQVHDVDISRQVDLSTTVVLIFV